MQETSNSGDDKGLREGLEKVFRQLALTLEKEGLKEIKAEGKFDPFLHEAIHREESPEVDEGKILEVYQKGYMLNGRVLRPAKVKVARRMGTEQAPKDTADSGAKQPAEIDNDQYTVK